VFEGTKKWTILKTKAGYLAGLKLHSEYSESLFRENVKTLAYYLYVARGCHEGRAFEHWIEAEKQLKILLASEPESVEPPPHVAN